MKQIMLVLAAVVLTFGVSAQQEKRENYVGLSFAGGLNTMTYSAIHGEQSFGLGLDWGLRYVHFFNERLGLGFGLHYTRANSYALYNFTEVSSGLTHADNVNIHYDLYAKFDNWTEHQMVDVLGIPIEMFYRIPVNEKCNFIGGLGLQLDLPVNGRYVASEGSYTTTGTFYFFGPYSVGDMPNHGFSTYDGTFDAKIDNLVPMVSVIADAGLRLTMSVRWGLYLGLYGSFGLTNMIGESMDNPLLMINAVDASRLDYYGTFSSKEIDVLHLLRLGIKVGIDFGGPGNLIKWSKSDSL